MNLYSQILTKYKIEGYTISYKDYEDLINNQWISYNVNKFSYFEVQ